MRHMVDKAAQTTLDTLKEILQDINDTCSDIKNSEHKFHRHLRNIQEGVFASLCRELE